MSIPQSSISSLSLVNVMNVKKSGNFFKPFALFAIRLAIRLGLCVERK